MAMHYFHLSNGHTIMDQEGIDQPDLNSVRNEALRVLRKLLNVGPTDKLWTGDAWKVWVTDQPSDGGQTILTLEVNAK
jgi:hypothetical protein